MGPAGPRAPGPRLPAMGIPFRFRDELRKPIGRPPAADGGDRGIGPRLRDYKRYRATVHPQRGV